MMEPQSDLLRGLNSVLTSLTSSLKFFGLIAVLAALILGSVAHTLTGSIQVLVVCTCALALLLAIFAVVYLAIWKPEDFRNLDDILAEASRFCRNIEGSWWEMVQGEGFPAISYVQISAVSGFPNVIIKGYAYNDVGALGASWATEAAQVYPKERMVKYQWRGSIPNRATADPASGYGEIAFDPSWRSGRGEYMDVVEKKEKPEVLKKVVLYVRASKLEQKSMVQSDSLIAREAVRKRLQGRNQKASIGAA